MPLLSSLSLYCVVVASVVSPCMAGASLLCPLASFDPIVFADILDSLSGIGFNLDSGSAYGGTAGRSVIDDETSIGRGSGLAGPAAAMFGRYGDGTAKGRK